MRRTLSMIVRDREGNPIYITERPVKIDPRELDTNHHEPVSSVSQATDEGGSDT